MLDRAYMLLPKEALNKERFEMPDMQSHIQGKKTIVGNFAQVLKSLHREERHILKYIAKETATSAVLSEGKLLLNSKFTREQVNKFFHAYITQYVLCHECHKPDTKFVEQQGIKMMKCDACGALSPVKRV